eukprot:tig00000492_g1451.t1
MQWPAAPLAAVAACPLSLTSIANLVLLASEEGARALIYGVRGDGPGFVLEWLLEAVVGPAIAGSPDALDLIGAQFSNWAERERLVGALLRHNALLEIYSIQPVFYTGTYSAATLLAMMEEEEPFLLPVDLNLAAGRLPQPGQSIVTPAQRLRCVARVCAVGRWEKGAHGQGDLYRQQPKQRRRAMARPGYSASTASLFPFRVPVRTDDAPGLGNRARFAAAACPTDPTCTFVASVPSYFAILDMSTWLPVGSRRRMRPRPRAASQAPEGCGWKILIPVTFLSCEILSGSDLTHFWT